MRSSNVVSVWGAVRGTQASIPVIRARTNLSYSTVTRALKELKAVKVEGTWPVEWSIPSESRPIEATVPRIAAEGVETVDVELVRADDLLARWEERREAFSAELKLLSISPDSDPKKLVAVLSNGAKALASLAYAIQQQQGKPDWYTILGGQIEAEFDHDAVVS